jgi:hypothetical protein
MLTLQITKEQIFSLIDQMSASEQAEVLQYLSQKLHSQPVDSQFDTDDAVNEVVLDGNIPHLQASEHPINQLSGKITAFQGVNAVAWQEQIRSEWDEVGLSH